jgi:hypothetical protein
MLDNVHVKVVQTEASNVPALTQIDTGAVKHLRGPKPDVRREIAANLRRK